MKHFGNKHSNIPYTAVLNMYIKVFVISLKFWFDHSFYFISSKMFKCECQSQVQSAIVQSTSNFNQAIHGLISTFSDFWFFYFWRARIFMPSGAIDIISARCLFDCPSWIASELGITFRDSFSLRVNPVS